MSARLEGHGQATTFNVQVDEVDCRGQGGHSVEDVLVREERVVLAVHHFNALNDGIDATTNAGGDIIITTSCRGCASGADIRDGRSAEGDERRSVRALRSSNGSSRSRQRVAPAVDAVDLVVKVAVNSQHANLASGARDVQSLSTEGTTAVNVGFNSVLDTVITSGNICRRYQSIVAQTL